MPMNRRLQYFFMMLFFTALFFSCDKDPSPIGLDLQPDEDKLGVFISDTTTLFAHSVLIDSIRTDETSISLLGSYYDPVFGSSTASIYTQIRLSTTSVNFGENPQLDSIVLWLDYTGDYYGDTTYPQMFRVYRLNESIYVDTDYYSNQYKELGDEIGNILTAPSPHDSITFEDQRLKAQLRIPLTTEFGESIINASPEDDLSSNDNFLEFLKGIYITSDKVQWGGAILNFDLPSPYSRLLIYYSNDEDDSLLYSFIISAANARFMHFEHYGYQNAGALFKQQVIDGNASLGNEQVYLQAMAGVKIKLEVPYLFDWVEENKIIINEALLVIDNMDPESDYKAPPSITLLKINDDGTSGYIPDQFEGANYFGGGYDDNSGEYSLRISRYFQQLLDGSIDNNGMYLIAAGASLMANRAVIVGSNPAAAGDNNMKIRLKLIYTKEKN
jgi:hypothetical protein